MGSKIPESVLVVIHTPDLRVLLLERADHPGFWQSVTGSKDSADEPLSLEERLAARFAQASEQDLLLPEVAAARVCARACVCVYLLVGSRADLRA